MQSRSTPTTVTEFDKISHLIRFGLSFHKMTPEVVNAWADKKILEQPADPIFFDLSTAWTTNKIVEILFQRVNWNFADDEIRDLILSYYNEYLNANPKLWYDIEKEVVDYFDLFRTNFSSEYAEDFLYFLQADWALRRDGFTGLYNMPEHLEDNLSKFKNYNKLKLLLDSQGMTGYEIQTDCT